MDTAVRRRAVGRGVLIGVLVTAVVIVALVLFDGSSDKGDKATTLGAIPTATSEHGEAAPSGEFERFD
ncbi:MAG TPA: hypothetical protein VMK16_03980, partial [Acidimicrobiales bacterium]|nr:hypothetical protein [Acidimicrobiales bacterium]